MWFQIRLLDRLADPAVKVSAIGGVDVWVSLVADNAGITYTLHSFVKIINMDHEQRHPEWRAAFDGLYSVGHPFGGRVPRGRRYHSNMVSNSLDAGEYDLAVRYSLLMDVRAGPVIVMFVAVVHVAANGEAAQLHVDWYESHTFRSGSSPLPQVVIGRIFAG